MASDPRTPIQSNVLGFEEILASGDTFMTPRNSLHSNNINSPHRPVVKTTTIIKDLRTSHSKSPYKHSPHRAALSTSICDKCGKCEACERRAQRLRSTEKRELRLKLDSPDKQTKQVMSPTGSSSGRSDHREAISPFQPQFITDASLSFKQSTKQSKWDTVKAITETIIKEKDMLIERQKLKRLQLEQQVRDLESKLRKITLEQQTPQPEQVSADSSKQLEKEELAYRRMSSSARLLSDNNSLAKVLMEKSQLERQLGEAEHTIAEMKCSLLTQKSDLQQQVEYYKKLLNLSQEQEQAMELKNDSMKTEGDYAVRELARLKLYLAELPTKEELMALRSSLSQTVEELSTSREHIDQLVDERTNIQMDCKRLNAELGESNEQVIQLLSQVSLLQKELSIWEQKEMLRDTTSDDDIVRLREQQFELHEDYEELKQLLECRQQEMDTMSRDYESRLSDVTSRFEQTESLLHTSQQDGANKDGEIESLSHMLEQIKEDHKELVDKSVANEEKVRVAEEVVSKETCKLEQSLIEEIVFCTSSLECLVEMYSNPQSLDLADTLAIRPTPVTISSPREYVSVLEHQTNSLKSMSETIERLRQTVLDKYADEMASSGHLECATQ